MDSIIHANYINKLTEHNPIMRSYSQLFKL